MSYSVDLETTMRECEHRVSQGIAVTTFAGGEQGPMVQISLGGEFVQLTEKQLRKLRRVLEYAQYHSLADWPGAS